jgi:TonB family protein
MTIAVTNLVAYSLQLGALALAALTVTLALRLRTPLPALRFWQAILVAAVLLPLVQLSAAVAPIDDTPIVLAALASTTSVNAIASRTPGVATWLLYLASIGVAIRLLWLTAGLVRLRAITRRAEPTTAFDPLMQSLSATLRATANVAITDAVATPATVGVRRPLILVPRRLLTLPEAVQRAVLAHELLHVRRRDWLHTIAEEAWCALLWFHPAARFISSRLALARETVVDEATILVTRDRRAYAEALLAFANPQPHLPGVTALIGRRQLSQRISLIAEEDVMTRRRTIVSFVVAVCVAGAAASAAVSAFPFTRGARQSVIYEAGDGITLPVVVREVKPSYTPEAMQNKIQGSVFLHVIVGVTGDVTDVTVTESLDREYGLDDEAVRAAWQWKFKPGTKDGKPVPVRVTIQLTFTLKK